MYNHLTKVYNDIGNSDDITFRDYESINRQNIHINTTYQYQPNSNRESIQYEEINDKFYNDPYYVND